jgi:DNA polymerase-1
MVEVLGRMEMRGIAVDRQVLSRLSGEFAQTLARLEAEIHDMAGEKFQIGSPSRLAISCSAAWACRARRRRRRGNGRRRPPSWRTRRAGPRAAGKNAGVAPARKTEIHLHGRPAGGDRPGDEARPHLVLARRTTTGRLSSTDPNLQNIPDPHRDRAKDPQRLRGGAGSKIISADYSQIELRILAHMADIPQLKQAFAENIDIHSATASAMFGVPLSR